MLVRGGSANRLNVCARTNVNADVAYACRNTNFMTGYDASLVIVKETLLRSILLLALLL